MEVYELLQALTGSFPSHPESVRLKLLGAVISGTQFDSTGPYSLF